ncbi:Glucose 1-dehydrogenase [Lachnellula subtilissima]|uniref:Glucose 1-dehydrogenase n=1 Tax=Lachnellula subtilissima TaxID=602034 RepID=A0A8H8U8Z1_9HELO|nr:Glucose 1-dehydrogenase [Lachnellula subtilissima]
MPYSLKGRNVLVTGGSRGLGELICLKFAAEGCNVAVNYNASEDRAKEVAEKVEGFGGKAVLVKGDMGIEADCISVVRTTIAQLSGLDIIISNAGYTRFSTFSDLSAPITQDWDLCHAVNVKAQFFLMREAAPTFKMNSDGGYCGGYNGGEFDAYELDFPYNLLRDWGSDVAYSVTKAAQLHLMRCLASTEGPKVRVNAVLPGWLATEWGMKYDPKRVEDLRDKSWLKKDVG